MNRITKCEECPLYTFIMNKKEIPVYRTGRRLGMATYKEIPFRGPTKNVEVVGVGESPGAYELHVGEMFRGDSGEVLEREMRAAGINPDSIFLANACRCMIMKKELGAKEVTAALKCCRPAVERIMAVLKPKLVICFGNMALRQITGKQGITQNRGKMHWSDEFGCWVLPMFHPAYCIRDNKHFTFFRPDMQQASSFIKGGFSVEDREKMPYRNVDSIAFILAQSNIRVAIDTETQGLDWTDKNSIVISYSVSDAPGKGYNVFLHHECKEDEADFFIVWPRKNGRLVETKRIPIKKASNFDQKIDELYQLLERQDIKKYMMNGGYDIHRFEQLGIPAREIMKSYVMDVQSAAHSLDPDNFKSASLQNIMAAHLPSKTDHKESSLKKLEKSDMLRSAWEHPGIFTYYACADADATLGCGLKIANKLINDKALSRYYVHLYHPIETEILYDIECNGIDFDIEKLPDTKERIASILRDTERRFIALAPAGIKKLHEQRGLRLTRTDFVRDVFFHKLGFGLKPPEKTPSGMPSVNRKVMKRIYDEMDDDHPAVRALSLYFEWGPYQKLYSTYLKGYEQAIRADGRLHTRVSKVFTATSRIGSRDPNLTNIPKRNKEIKNLIRRHFVAPPGWTFLLADYSQNELRWVAHQSQDPEFLRVYRSGDDIHVNTGKQLAAKRGLNWNNISDEDRGKYRQSAKIVNFGLIYMMQAKGLQKYAHDEYGVDLTLADANLFLEGYFQKYGKIHPWQQEKIGDARRNGFVRTPFGAIRRTPNINSNDFFIRAEDERRAVNTPIQSAGSDLCLFSALHVKRSGDFDTKKAKLALFIHDELIYLTRDDYLDEFAPILKHHMENPPVEHYFGFKLSVPWKADFKTGKNLADTEDYNCKG